jgi:hypothetical protein
LPDFVTSRPGKKNFVANSGLIVVDEYRGLGLAKAIKNKAFELSRERYSRMPKFLDLPLV